MNIQLKNFKHSAIASRETYFFTAELYIDGKHIGACFNEGSGGATHLFSIHEYPQYDASKVEEEVDNLVHKMICEKQDKALMNKVKKILSKSVCFRKKGAGVGEYSIYKDAVGTLKEKLIYEKLKQDPEVEMIYNLVPLETAVKSLYPDLGNY